jgi:hypothetical protein
MEKDRAVEEKEEERYWLQFIYSRCLYAGRAEGSFTADG